ncbi:MAG TPA: DUF2911 domain-containing protein [Thermoanaerobaculia bacterium]|nr:DUF2911 domain-containing protein [Thermoanaerobaculia bacterium]
MKNATRSGVILVAVIWAAALVVPMWAPPLQAQQPASEAQQSSDGSAGAAAPTASAQTASQAGSDTAQRRRRGGDAGEALLAIQGKEIKIAYPKLKADSGDFAALERLVPGGVHSYDGGRAFKLLTAYDLAFGDRVVKAGNASPDYPGVYSVWLKRADDGSWSLVFNEQADIWGSQREPNADVLEVRLRHSPAPVESAQVELALEQAGETGGVLRVTWGPHRWEAPFTVR